MVELSENKPIYSCFLSASTSNDDKIIVEWFSELLKVNNIEPIFATYYPEPRPPQEKIEDFIKKSDMFIAVLTRREKIEGREEWTGPEWVQNEIAIAHILKKPIALFVEENVQINRSIGPYITDYIRFNRKKMHIIKSKADTFIKAIFNAVDEKRFPPKEKEIINNTVVEYTEEGWIERTIISTARRLIQWKYGRLDVSLQSFFILIILLMIIPSYFIYDYLYGQKNTEPIVFIISTIVLILLILIPSLARQTRCRNCNSYFSERVFPITYGDLNNFPNLPENRRLLKYKCEVCETIKYNTEERV